MRFFEVLQEKNTFRKFNNSIHKSQQLKEINKSLDFLHFYFLTFQKISDSLPLFD